MRTLFYSKTNLLRNIEFKKIGLIIRHLTKKEQEEIFNKIWNYFNNPKTLPLYNDYLKTKNSGVEIWEKEYKFLKEMQELSEFDRNALLLRQEKEKKGLAINEVLINNELSKIIVIEQKEEVFTKNFEKQACAFLVGKILLFSIFLDESLEEKDAQSISSVDYENFIKEENVPFYTTVIDIDNKLLTDYSFSKLTQIEELLNSNDEEFNFNFFPLIDLVINQKEMPENLLVNMVSFLERLLIKENEDKCKNFVLKVGILCNEFFSEIDNKNLSDRIKSFYEIRSNIVHGDSFKNFKNIQKYEKIFNYDTKIYSKDSKYVKRMLFLNIINIYLKECLVRVFNKYLENPKLLEYIKNN